MTKFKKQLTAALSAGSLFFSMATPALAGTTITVSGNGAFSENEAEVEMSNSTSVFQSNTAQVSNVISSNSTTGNNNANQNTSGDVLIRTGDALSDVSVENLLNSNHASVDCCDAGDLEIEISGNGAYSDNDVEVGDDDRHRRQDENDGIFVTQDNDARVSNEVDSDAKTGSNNANQNTNGDVAIGTGDATSIVAVSTTANANSASVGGGNSAGGSVSAKILGNGANTENEIELELDDDITITQANYAEIRNGIDADAKTGYNDAYQNTAGEAMILTGDALVDVEVDNMVNFNWADVDCGCLEDLDLKVAGNGAESDSKIEFEADNDLWVNQGYEGSGNEALLSNEIEGDAKTGRNSLDQSTGEDDSDPAILTGDAASYVDVENSGNVNSFGEGWSHELPWDFDFHFSFDLDWSDLLAML